MAAISSSTLTLKSDLEDFDASDLGDLEFGSGGGLQATVVFTTWDGTKAALRLAVALAKNLGLRIRLLAVYAVPLHFPLDRPPVSLDFLERSLVCLVPGSQVHAEEVSIEIFLCRTRTACLRQVLSPRSLVVVGGRKRRWLNSARKLKRWLAREGHHVIFAEVASRRFAF